MLPVAAYALAAARHMHEFGTTPEQLAAVAVAARAWAQKRPRAWTYGKGLLTVDDVLSAPRVCDPLGVRDCCVVTDGGPFVASGAVAPGGALPMNTNGGGLSYQHPGMYGLLLLVEAVRQIREGGHDVVLGHGNGGVLSAQATVILGSEAAAT
jgi:acetyl-CoA acetyltransferase